MRTIKFLLYKEFKQIFRNKSIVALILFMPIMQLLILPWAADYEVKNINVVVVDQDYSTYTQELISKISASNYFNLVANSKSYDIAYQFIESDAADLVLVIPPDRDPRDRGRDDVPGCRAARDHLNAACAEDPHNQTAQKKLRQLPGGGGDLAADARAQR